MQIGVGMLVGMFPPSVGGIQTHTLQLSAKLVERGAEVHVVTRGHAGAPAEELVQGVHVHRVGTPWKRRALATGHYLASGLRCLYGLRGRIDVLHAHQLLSPTSLGLAASALLEKPLLLNPHACGPIGDVGVLARHGMLLGRGRLHAARTRADGFIAISKTIHEELRGIGIPEARIFDLANGVDLVRFRAASASERQELRAATAMPPGPVAVYTGRLSHEKGVDVLLDAWPAVLRAQPQATLLVLGDGAERAALEAQALRLGIAGRVSFRGAISDVAPYVRGADVAVLPSRTEGLPVALLEAMAAGAPVVATAVGGSAQVLRDRVTGLLVPPEDPAALADALALALAGGAAVQSLAREARACAERDYSIDAIADQVLAVYRRLLLAREAQSPRLVRGAT